jgi:hypothetical protein
MSGEDKEQATKKQSRSLSWSSIVKSLIAGGIAGGVYAPLVLSLVLTSDLAPVNQIGHGAHMIADRVTGELSCRGFPTRLLFYTYDFLAGPVLGTAMDRNRSLKSASLD